MVSEKLTSIIRLVLETLGVSTSFTRLLLFISFFALSAVAIKYNHKTNVRNGFVVMFFGLLLLSPLIGQILWPFWGWGIFGFVDQEELTHYEVRIVDESGAEINYDADAINPVTQAVLRRYAGEMDSEFTEQENKEFGRFLLDQATLHREKVSDPRWRVWRLMKFPDHQLDYRWSPSEVNKYDEFETIRVYQVNSTFQPGWEGEPIRNQSESVVLQVNRTSVVRN